MNQMRVFLSYAASDRKEAELIADRLASVGAMPLIDKLTLEAGQPVLQTLRSELASTDCWVLLLSPAALASEWAQRELEYVVSRDLRQRAIAIVLIKVKPCPTPEYLESWTVIDATRNLSHGAATLASFVQVAPLVKLETLDPPAAEAFVGDLLRAYNFKAVQPATTSRDVGFDFTAQSTQRDPFGRVETVEWVVQVKATRQQAGLGALHAFVGALSLRRERGLFVTTSQLTGPTRAWLDSLEAGVGQRVSILEGEDLRRLAMARPKVVRKHFNEPTAP